MIYALVGHSASGKSTIERVLEQAWGIPRIISYTTRPPRDMESQGVDYNFVDEETFLQMLEDGLFTEHATYRDWHYGLSLEDINYKEEDYVVVVTPKGFYELLDVVGYEWIRSMFISVGERERMLRLLNRGDDIDEVMRRIHADRVDFAEFESDANFIIDNKEIDKSADMAYTIIKCLNK